VAIGGASRTVTFDEEAGRFEVDIPSAGSAVMNVRLRGTTLSILHTDVPRTMRGQGVGETLARAALEHARTRGWTIRPYCPFVAGFIARRQEYASMVDPSFVPAGDA
jgi:predicted GNAT family acetyltransferase